MGVVQGESHPEPVVIGAVAVSGPVAVGQCVRVLAEHPGNCSRDAILVDLFRSPVGRPACRHR